MLRGGMRHAVELNHVATASTCARRPVGLCWLHPVTPSGVALYRSARGAPLAVRSRLARVKVRSRRRRALCGGSALRCRPVVSSPTASLGTLSTIYIVISIRERVKHSRHLFCTICPYSSFRAVSQRLECASAALSPRYGLAPSRGQCSRRFPSGGAGIGARPAADVARGVPHRPSMPTPRAARCAPGRLERPRWAVSRGRPASPVCTSIDHGPPSAMPWGGRRTAASRPAIHRQARPAALDTRSTATEAASALRHRPGRTPIRRARPADCGLDPLPTTPRRRVFPLAHVPMTGSPPPARRPVARWRPSSARANAETPRGPPAPAPAPRHARARGERVAPISAPATTEAKRARPGPSAGPRRRSGTPAGAPPPPLSSRPPARAGGSLAPALRGASQGSGRRLHGPLSAAQRPSAALSREIRSRSSVYCLGWSGSLTDSTPPEPRRGAMTSPDAALHDNSCKRHLIDPKIHVTSMVIVYTSVLTVEVCCFTATGRP